MTNEACFSPTNSCYLWRSASSTKSNHTIIGYERYPEVANDITGGTKVPIFLSKDKNI
jgi:hypothetical protein